MTVPDFIWWLMRETGIYAARGAYPDGKARQANLDALYQRALDGMKGGNMRLSDFVNDLQQARETKLSDSDVHPAMGADDNFVRIMTMHKSKGLEFPAVILMDLQKSVRGRRSNEKLRVDISSSGGALGLYLPAVQRRKHSIMDSQGREAFDIRVLRKNISEETRLLYVAMTRAMQKLCLIGSVKDGEEALWMNQTRAARIWKTRSMLDMIMPAVLKRIKIPETGMTARDKLWRVSCVSGKAIGDSEKPADPVDLRIGEALPGEEETPLYIPGKPESVPLKTSVTTLAQQARVLSDRDSEETVEDKRKTEEAVRTFRLSTEAVRIGTVTHRFIRLINLDALCGENADMDRAIRAEVRRMESEGILTPEEARMVRIKGVISFFRSELGRRMLQSGEIKREAGFTMRIDPHAPTMVQGIVDCAFRENGEWILIDYKTDYNTDPDIFVPRHEIQMIISPPVQFSGLNSLIFLARRLKAVDGVRIPSFGLAAEQESISFPTRQGYRLVYILFLPGGQIQKGLADDGVRAALKGKRTVFFIFLLPIIVIIRFPDELLQLTALMLGQNPGGG